LVEGKGGGGLLPRRGTKMIKNQSNPRKVSDGGNAKSKRGKGWGRRTLGQGGGGRASKEREKKLLSRNPEKAGREKKGR